jgi:hypothetical protein
VSRLPKTGDERRRDLRIGFDERIPTYDMLLR